ncbi:MAG: GNAT family N-acetyltransferase [Anaerolineae bacterium]|nr:GNAT family N-acetyltransferase [Anaerolineae bacterium]
MAADPSIEGLTIRPAAAADEALIRRMVRAERLDPTQLRWPNFLIAEMGDTVVGIGQIRRHRTCEELGSLAVTADYRQRGVASALLRALEARAGRPLYLLCAGRMQPFYERFGYRIIAYGETPAPLRLKRLLMIPFRLAGVRVIAMRKDS